MRDFLIQHEALLSVGMIVWIALIAVWLLIELANSAMNKRDKW